MLLVINFAHFVKISVCVFACFFFKHVDIKTLLQNMPVIFQNEHLVVSVTTEGRHAVIALSIVACVAMSDSSCCTVQFKY